MVCSLNGQQLISTYDIGLLNGRFGFINRSGEVVIDPQFEFAGDIFEGFPSVRIRKKCWFTGSDEKIVIELKYDSVGDFTEEIAECMDRER